MPAMCFGNYLWCSSLESLGRTLSWVAGQHRYDLEAGTWGGPASESPESTRGACLADSAGRSNDERCVGMDCAEANQGQSGVCTHWGGGEEKGCKERGTPTPFLSTYRWQTGSTQVFLLCPLPSPGRRWKSLTPRWKLFHSPLRTPPWICILNLPPALCNSQLLFR